MDATVGNALKKNYLRSLEGHYRKKNQLKLNRSLLINGMPERQRENLVKIVIMIARYAGVFLKVSDILNVHRENRVSWAPGDPGSINAEFKDAKRKEAITAGLRRRGGVTTKDLKITGENHQLYVYDHLTPYYQKLLAKCRDFGKEQNYKFVWVKNGEILVRKDETSKVVRVNTEEDLLRLV